MLSSMRQYRFWGRLRKSRLSHRVPAASPHIAFSIQHLAFSLIEVLVALAIFALAVAVLAQSVSNAIHGLEVVKSDSHKAQLYRFAMRQILQIEDRDEVEDGGSFETPEDGPVDWSAEIEETEILDLFTLTVELKLDEKGGSIFDRDEGYVEKVYVYRPNWSDSADRQALLDDKRTALDSERRLGQ